MGFSDRLRRILSDQASTDARPTKRSSHLPDPLSGRIQLSKPATQLRGPAVEGDATADAAVAAVAARIAGAHMGLDNPEAALARVTFSDQVHSNAVVEALRTYGMAVFPSIYSPERLARVQAEFEALMAHGAAGRAMKDSLTDTSTGYSFSPPRLPDARFNEVRALFASPTIRAITDEIFSGQGYEFNTDIFAQTTGHTEAPPSGTLHWDKQLTLKSWLYVTDGHAQQGPMRAAMGSNRWLRYVREDAMHDGIPYGSIRNSVSETGLPIVSTGGPAGTFFLFLTDTAHGASPVAEGETRNIIRNRSRPIRVKEWSGWAAKIDRSGVN